MDSATPPGAVIAFVLDTSISMNLKYEKGVTYFDAAKSAIAFMLKRSAEWHKNRNLQVAVFTYGATPFAFQSRFAIDPNFNQFLTKLNLIRAVDAFNGDMALQAAYEYLHLIRMEYNLDTLGEGRKPWCGVPGYVCWLTDGEAIVRKEIVANKFESVPAKAPGLQYFQNDFRCDQRLFVYYFNQRRRPPPRYLDDFTKARGGHVFPVPTAFDVRNFIEAQSMKLPSRTFAELSFGNLGTLVNFLDLESPSETGPNAVRLLLTRSFQLSPPIFSFPENYWATSATPRLPVRETYPTVYFERSEKKVFLHKSYPRDVYQVQSCQMTEELLSRRNPQFWTVHMVNSFTGKTNSFPFAYLTANQTRTGVEMVVLGYNYPMLLKILDKPLSNPQRPVDAALTKEIKNHLEHTPFYHHKSILEMFVHLGVHAIDPKNFTYAETEAMQDVRSAVARARQEFRTREYHLFPNLSIEGPKKAPQNLIKDALSVPRNKLLSSLHTQKHYFFECGRVDEASRITEAHPPNKRSVSIESMQDHSVGVNRFPRLRNPFDTEEDIRHQEKIAYGNLYASRDDAPERTRHQGIEDEAVTDAPLRVVGHRRTNRPPRRRSVGPTGNNGARIPSTRAISALSDSEDDPNFTSSQASTPSSSREPSPPTLPDTATLPPPEPASTPPPPEESPAQVIASTKSWAAIKAELILLVKKDDKAYDEADLIQRITAIDLNPTYTSIKKVNLFASITYHAKIKRRKELQDLLDSLIRKNKALS